MLSYFRCFIELIMFHLVNSSGRVRVEKKQGNGD